jgi:lipopolysaccharide transport system ATP-binding protein
MASGENDIAIRVDRVSKCYAIYDHPRDRLMEAIVGRLYAWAKPLFSGWVLHAYHREFWALRDISFSIPRGQAVGVVGRNGAGKSTLLQIIAGTLTPTSGNVEIGGKVAALLELGSGFNPEFTGRENVYLNASLWGLSQEETDSKFGEIAAFADIGSFIEQPVKIYSSGMLVRLAFAVQTAVNSQILIVDEALAVGDARFQKKCYERLSQYRASGGTVFFVTHDTGVVNQVCSLAMLLEQGQIVEMGKPHRIAKVYHRLLFGDPNESVPIHEPWKIEHVPSANVSIQNNISVPDQLLAKSSSKEQEGEEITQQGRELRYGSRELEIEEIGIRDMSGFKTTLLEAGDEYIFFFKVRYSIDTSGPVSFGFIITNTLGIEIYGTKSGLHGFFLPVGACGTVVEARMNLKVRQVPGQYFLSVAVAPVTAEASSEFFDMRFDALPFRVIGETKCFTTSMVDMGGALSFEQL